MREYCIHKRNMRIKGTLKTKPFSFDGQHIAKITFHISSASRSLSRWRSRSNQFWLLSLQFHFMSILSGYTFLLLIFMIHTGTQAHIFCCSVHWLCALYAKLMYENQISGNSGFQWQVQTCATRPLYPDNNCTAEWKTIQHMHMGHDDGGLQIIWIKL